MSAHGRLAFAQNQNAFRSLFAIPALQRVGNSLERFCDNVGFFTQCLHLVDRHICHVVGRKTFSIYPRATSYRSTFGSRCAERTARRCLDKGIRITPPTATVVGPGDGAGVRLCLGAPPDSRPAQGCLDAHRAI